MVGIFKMANEKYELTFFDCMYITKRGYKDFACESEEDMQEIVNLLNEKDDLINGQKGIIQKLEEHNELLVKKGIEAIHQISDEKDKLIYEAWANSLVPRHIILDKDNIGLFLEDYDK